MSRKGIDRGSNLQIRFFLMQLYDELTGVVSETANANSRNEKSDYQPTDTIGLN